MERKLKIDDPVGAISVHGVNGPWGVIALGLFADGTYGDGLNGVAGAVKGLFYGDASQLGAQLIAVVTNFVFVFAVMSVFQAPRRDDGAAGRPRARVRRASTWQRWRSSPTPTSTCGTR